MNEYYANKELCLLAKQAGFDYPCLRGYDKRGNIAFFSAPIPNGRYEIVDEYYCMIPEITVLQKWVWEKHKVFITIKQSKSAPLFYYLNVKNPFYSSCPYRVLEVGLTEFLQKTIKDNK